MSKLKKQKQYHIVEDGDIKQTSFRHYMEHEISQSRIDRANISRELEDLKNSLSKLERDQFSAVNSIQTNSIQSSAELSRLILQGINDAVAAGRQKVLFQAALTAASVSFVLTALWGRLG